MPLLVARSSKNSSPSRIPWSKIPLCVLKQATIASYYILITSSFSHCTSDSELDIRWNSLDDRHGRRNLRCRSVLLFRRNKAWSNERRAEKETRSRTLNIQRSRKQYKRCRTHATLHCLPNSLPSLNKFPTHFQVTYLKNPTMCTLRNPLLGGAIKLHDKMRWAKRLRGG